MKSSTMGSLVSLAFILFISGSFTLLIGQCRFQSHARGAWSAPATWTLVSGTSGTGVPGPADTADILASYTVSIGGVTADCARLIVEANGTLAIDGAASVQVDGNPGSADVYGTLAMTAGGTLLKAGTGTCSFAIAAAISRAVLVDCTSNGIIRLCSSLSNMPG